MREATALFGGNATWQATRQAQAHLSRHQNPTIYIISNLQSFLCQLQSLRAKSTSKILTFSSAMSSPEASSSIPFRSKKALKPTSNSKAIDHSPLSSKTPEKPPQLSRRSRNRNVALSIKEVRRAAESLRESNRKQSGDRTDQVASARRKIASWLDDDEAPATKSKNDVGAAARLPEKYESLCEFFNCLDSSIRLLRLKGLMPTFTNICPKIECLTDRRFTYDHLAQLKFILPEVIEIKRVLLLDERTSCMKPNLHVTINVDALENAGKLKSEAGNTNLRKVFRSRLVDFSKSHPEGDEVPKEILPEPFNCTKQDISSKTIKNSSPLSLPEAISYAHTADQPEDSATSLGSDGFPEEIQPVPPNQLKENMHSNINIVPNPLLPMETSSEASKTQQPAVASHLSQSFRRRFSHKVRNEVANSDEKLSEILQHAVHSVPETRLNSISFSEEPCSAHLCDSVNATPSKEISCVNKEDGSPVKNASIHSTPAKLSTPARLMTATPALQPPKRCYMSPVDDSTCSPNKLVRRPPRSRSLKFDTPVKNKKTKDEVPDIDDELLDNETPDIDGESVNSDILDILPEDLLQSIRNKERKAMEEQNPAISQAKRRQKMIACLPKLFNMIHFLFQSISRSVITKEELLHKIISSHSDIVDRREVEEQLCLLLELVPDWISEKLASGGDLLIRINKTSSPESLRSRLEEAK
ncbi:hypothetical protein FEM48_Zijuj09G0055300 [Ziziphus jujuba var. spinosa]|uniref:CDT1 Geminin-binding domain-containing protein n=1 Tax=Ziziphus jujuba var. spinosa TaxID=714518 RepID=A0A978UR59_ZIZJJ|nr:hypothetical protein FEM48_Zijuj09G0055300 [Ziziphus jujuba var. spinosa]